MSETAPAQGDQISTPANAQRNPILSPQAWDWLGRGGTIVTLGTGAIALLFYFINLEVRVQRLEAQMQATTITTALKGDGGQITSATVNPVLQACAELGKNLANAKSIDAGYIKSAMEAMACEKMPAPAVTTGH
jgi:hypothetical protein